MIKVYCVMHCACFALVVFIYLVPKKIQEFSTCFIMKNLRNDNLVYKFRD